jgi:ring-1,2-phenylacetyl-CoA epoxidase subunit PaaE
MHMSVPASGNVPGTNGARIAGVAFALDGGVVAALSTARRLLAEAPSKRVAVFYGHESAAPTEAAAEALEQLLSLKDKHLQRLSLAMVMERDAEEAELLSGRLDAARVRAMAGRLFDPKTVQEYFVCGPASFARDISGALATLGVDPTRIHIEGHEVVSSPNGAAGATPGARETQVSFVMDGRRRSFTMHTDEESILDAAARAGIDLPFSCKAGVCSTCRTKLVSGKVDLVENYALEDWELEQGFILACQARARTPEIELTYDEK